MKKRKGKMALRLSSALLAVLLAVLMAATMSGCQTPTPAASAAPTASTPAAATTAATATAAEPTAAPVYKDEITIDYYFGNTNYSGIIGGWFGKVLKDKFNMKVNMIAPNISGAAIFQTRSAAGNLGDIVVLGSDQLADSVKAGLFMDMTDLLNNYGGDIKLRASTAIKATQDFLKTDKIYAIPDNLSNLSPTSPLPDIEGAMPCTQSGGATYLRWDVYQAIGAPKINTMEDLLPVIKKMQEQDPTSISGKKTYGFSFFKDWDGQGMKAIFESFPTMYGYEFAPGTSTIMTYGDPKTFQTQRLDDDAGLYYRTLKFYYQANQMGLVDPDSPSLNWDNTCAKVKDGQTLFYWWPWASMAQYNNQTNGNANPPTGFEFVPIADQKYYDSGYNPLGQWGQYVSIGIKAKYPERLMAFLNWTATSEGEETLSGGPKGLFWDVQNGEPVLTDFGKQAKQDNTILVPDSWGGGAVKDDGTWVTSFIYWDEIDPNYNVPYRQNLWPSVMKSAETKLDQSWQAAMGAQNMIDYITKNNMLSVAPGNSYVPPTDTTDIKNERSQCAKVIVDSSWQMVFAKDQATFDSLWTNMKAQLQGLGWENIAAVDLKNAKDFNAACLQTIAASSGK